MKDTKITKISKRIELNLIFSQLFFVYFVTSVVNYFIITGKIVK